MLVLSRKVHESIIINDNIEIKIIDLKGEQVKIGIKAPNSVRIYRGEIYEAIQKQNVKAAQSTLPEDISSLFSNNDQNTSKN